MVGVPKNAKDTMVQDVNPLNASIYLDDYMYVGARKMLCDPEYFAPYFTNECAHNREVPKGTVAGIGSYSRVVKCLEVPWRELRVLDAEGIDKLVPAGPHADDWKRGLARIAKRPNEEKNKDGSPKWKESNDPHRLYFLDVPVPLGRVIKKDGWLPEIPHGFGTRFDLLNTATTLKELKV